MYEVLVNNKALYYPGNATYTIYATNLSQEIGLAGEFEFTVPAENPQYGTLENGAIITILKDNAEYWRGEVRNIEYDFNKNAKVYALEDVAWLGDEFLTPAYIDSESYAQRFRTVIGAYNSTRPSDRQFAVGYITNVTSANICTWQTEYEESILDDIRKCICKDSGYIRVRRVTSGGSVTRYIDILKIADYGKLCNQPIQFAYNLLEYAQEFDLGNITNVLTPYGDELDNEIYEGVNARLEGTTITNQTSINVYGRHAKAVIFDGATELTQLNTLAAAYLTRYSQPELTLEVSAIDLSDIDNWQSIDIGDSIRVVANPFSIDQWLYVTEFDTDLQNVDRNKITLSGTVRRDRTLTSQTTGTAEAVKNIPSKSSILEAARKNALEILNGTDGGYVTFETNASDQITELRIANNLDYEQATKCWRWNLGGLAYLSRNSANEDWTVVTAATMDGGFVANFITTGTLRAQNDDYTLDMETGEVVMKNGSFKGTITSTDGSIGGFSITANSLGTPMGSVGCGMATGGGHGVNLYAWDSSYNCRVYQGKITCSTGSSSGKGIYVYAGQDENGHYILHGHSDVYSDQYGGVEWTGSDRNLKKNIEDLTLEKAKELIYGAKARKFDFKAKDGKRYGFIAQELREILDDDSDIEYKSEMGDTCNIHYQDFIAPLCMIVKDLQNQINELKGEQNG